jgi:OmpA-OmpF porin, OOP family
MGSIVLRWLWALPLVGVIWGGAVLKEQPRIEADLKTRADAALQAAGLSWASTTFEGIDATVTGRAYTEKSRDEAKKLVAKAWGVWQVRDGTELIERRENYVWAAALTGGAIRLSGYFPNPSARQGILKIAAETMPDAKVHDDMEAARGAPDQTVWLPAMRFSLGQLGRLKSGEVRLVGRNLSVVGVARNSAAYEQLKHAFAREVPKGIKLAKDEVRPPTVSPYTWSATVDANQFILAGFVPSQAARERLMAAAKAAFPKRAIVDKMDVAGGEPRGWLDTVKALIGTLAKLRDGTIAVKGDTLTIKGVAVAQATAEEVQDLLGKIGAHYHISHNISYLEPTIPTVSPFVTSFLKDAKRFRLSGYAPDQAAIDRLITAAKKRVPDHQVVSSLAIARGAPEGWNLCITAGLEAMAKLDSGRAELVGRKLQVSGVTTDEEVGLSLPKLVRAAANRACTDVVEVKLDLPPEPNLKWQTEVSKTQVRLKGDVPNSEVKANLAKMAKTLFGKRQIVDEMRVKPARSTKWPKVAGALLELLAKLREGEVSIDGQSIGLKGQAPDTSVATAIKARLKRGLSKGYTGDPKIEIKSDAMIWAEEEAKRQAEARKVAEEKRRLAEEARLKAEADEARRKLEEAKQQAAEEARRNAKERQRARDDELLRRLRERRERLADEAKRRQEEAAARLRAEEEARRQAIARRQAEDERLSKLARERRERLAAEVERKAAAEAEARRRAEQERKAAAEAERKRAAEEAERKAAEEAKRKAAEAEAQRRAEEERRAAEERRKAAAEAERKRAAEAARLKAEEDRRRRAAEEAKRKAEEHQRASDEALLRRLRERRERLAEEARRKAEAEAEARRRERDERLRRLARERRERLTPKQRARETVKAKRCEANFGKVITRNRIQFRFESAELLPRSRRTLDRLIRRINSCTGILIEIGGHTDSLGSTAFNQRLSEQRALAVFNYLVAGGVPAERLVTKGYGETKPRFRNRGIHNRSLNRRIEFKPVWE